MRAVPRLALLLLLLPACLLSACGKEQEPAPAVFDVKAPKGARKAAFPRVGMTLEHPRNWKLRRRDAPGVFELLSGEAVVAAWAYERDEPLPKTESELDSAKDRLVEAIELRDPEYRLLSAETGEVAGAPAIDVRGEQVISKRRLRVRSVHVFEGETEYVIEAIAPPRDHRLVDTRVLAPLLRSLEIEGPEDQR
jgi:hypothetical protein